MADNAKLKNKRENEDVLSNIHTSQKTARNPLIRAWCAAPFINKSATDIEIISNQAPENTEPKTDRKSVV